MKKYENLQTVREKYIRLLDEAEIPSVKASIIAEQLFALDLTVYSKNYSFDSIVYNAFAKSILDDNISLHPEQIRIVEKILIENALIISAPTSFGKTFCIFEYIAKYKPNNVVLVVPTLALGDEYFRKIIKKYRNSFSEYKIHTNITKDDDFSVSNNNIFILTHDRVVNENLCERLPTIDFLVIDEVYKLATDKNNDRVLVLNMAYYRLSLKANKYVLLAPFIGAVENAEKLHMKPVFWKTDYSPVINDVIQIDLLLEDERNPMIKEVLDSKCRNDKTLIYFPTVSSMNKYILDYIKKEPIMDNLSTNVIDFINWAREEIHEDWCVIVALERGYLIHNGQIPLGIRTFQLDCYDSDKTFNRMLCTSTLLEGVNTTAKNIIITRPSRKSNKSNTDYFEAFDFFNLVGRTGRLNENFIGKAYYLRGPNDPIFEKEAAVKSIKFELTVDSKDIDIQKGDYEKHPDFIAFINELNITHEDYINNIGVKVRFDNVVTMYKRYLEHKNELLEQLNAFIQNDKQGRFYLVEKLYLISGGVNNEDKPKDLKLNASLINDFLNKKRLSLKAVLNNAIKYYGNRDINDIISKAIRLKESFIENSFYNKVLIISYFLKTDKVKNELINVLNEKIISPIETLYFANSKNKKALIDLGVYDRDIKKIIDIIGDDFEDAVELRHRLIKNRNKFNKISFISKYAIDRIIE
ncbi:MAG: DEAD/DEAH box helicase family protein [Solobacterium sp.]|nr:DEAD/DEAH box helicase family protein [Solobacterium sp.]MDY5402269.1 DEAD/DEAH box helicase family protein [Erysipelotrichaceae bacterium]